ncbi:MAG: hypothetical protein AAFV80_17220, partial [Bacteroidota bacterium]
AEALPLWELAYTTAPAANGKTSVQYRNGVTMLTYFVQNETDAAKKEELTNKVMGIFDAHINCFPKEEIATLGDKANFLFYQEEPNYQGVFDAANEALEKGDKKLEAKAIYPLAVSTVTLFSEEQVNEDQARAIHKQLNEIAAYWIENASKDKTKKAYQQAIDASNASFDLVAEYLFDCEYFKKKLTPLYEANPDDYENIKDIRIQLVQGGCEETEPMVAEIKAKMVKHIAEVNDANAEARWEALPPANKGAVKLKEGEYREAIGYYEQAISEADAADKKGDYSYAIAQAHYKLKEYSKARTAARNAAKYKPNWGKPYMLIGNLYASSTRSCGDAYEGRMVVLAAIEKYAYAKSIDSEVADDANKRIARLSGSKPLREDAFARGHKDGDPYKVGCWIGETVTIRTIKGY